MKSIVFTDLHIGCKKDSVLYLQIALDFIKTIADYGKKYEINNIICCGDLFDNRQWLNLKTIETGIKIGEILNNFNTYLIAGNHDIHFKDLCRPNSLMIFEDRFSNIKIIDEDVYYWNNMAFIPYLYKDLKSINKDIKYLFGHFDIVGFKMTGDNYCINGFDVKDFKRFEKVFSGHFHIPSEDKNIKYLGSPYQLDFGDWNTKRGFYIFDDSNGNIEFIEYTDAPTYEIFNYKKIDENKIKNNFIKILFDKDISFKEITDLLDNINSLNPNGLVSDYRKIDMIEENENIELNLNINIQSTKDILKSYISTLNLPNYIKPNTLDKIIDSLYIN